MFRSIDDRDGCDVQFHVLVYTILMVVVGLAIMGCISYTMAVDAQQTKTLTALLYRMDGYEEAMASLPDMRYRLAWAVASINAINTDLSSVHSSINELRGAHGEATITPTFAVSESAVHSNRPCATMTDCAAQAISHVIGDALACVDVLLLPLHYGLRSFPL